MTVEHAGSPSDSMPTIPTSGGWAGSVDAQDFDKVGTRKGEKGAPNQALHHDRGRILVPRDTTSLQRPRQVN
jgi:hypothetical protein